MKRGLLRGIKEYVYLKHAEAVLKGESTSSDTLLDSQLDENDKVELSELKGKTIEEIDAWLIKKLITPKYKKTIENVFEEQLRNNTEYYHKVISSYFAHLILLGSVNGADDKKVLPKNLESFKTLENMFSLTTLVDTTNSNEEAITEADSGDSMTLEGVLRWFTDTYVYTQFEYLLLSYEGNQDALIWGIVPEEYKTEPVILKQALAILKESMDVVYFIRLRSVLFNTLRDVKPPEFYKRGEFDARSMVTSHQKFIEDIEKADLDFVESEKELNRIWLLVMVEYQKKYKKPLGKGKITGETYRKEILPILNKLKNDGEKVETISQLYLLDNKFDKDIIMLVKNFGKGV